MTAQNTITTNAAFKAASAANAQPVVTVACGGTGNYTITVQLPALLTHLERVDLIKAIRRAQDDCLAGGFVAKYDSVCFHRETSLDSEHITSNFPALAQSNFEEGAKLQLACEILDNQPTNKHLRQIVDLLSGTSVLETVRQPLANVSEHDSTRLRCANCCELRPHAETACVLHALVGVLRDRGENSESELEKIYSNCDVDKLWEHLGPVIVELQDCGFHVETSQQGS